MPPQKRNLIIGLLFPLAYVYSKSLNFVRHETFKINFSSIILKIKPEDNPLFFTNYYDTVSTWVCLCDLSVMPRLMLANLVVADNTGTNLGDLK